MLATFAVAGLFAWGAASAQATTQAYTYTGGEQVFTVPAGVFSLHVVAMGGAAGLPQKPPAESRRKCPAT